MLLPRPDSAQASLLLADSHAGVLVQQPTVAKGAALLEAAAKATGVLASETLTFGSDTALSLLAGQSARLRPLIGLRSGRPAEKP